MTIAKKAHPQVVVVIPLTKNNATIILAEQYREAVKANVIGLPAGHIGDDPGHEKENALEAAKRELLEETGYEGDLYYLSSAASSPGMTDEITHFVLALNVVKKAEGGGGEENITVREVFFGFLKDYLESKPNCIVSAQMLAGLWAARSFLK
jgi:ADP-ribose pyrophosphatase